MIRKIGLWLLWLGFVAYTLALAPLDQPGNLDLIRRLILVQWSGIEPILIVIFSLMGVWPLIYACLMFADARVQRIPAWPAFLAANGAGAIGLLPYLILRQARPEFSGQQTY